MIRLPSTVTNVFSRSVNNINQWMDKNVGSVYAGFPTAVLESPEAGHWRELEAAPQNHVYMDMLWAEVARIGLRICNTIDRVDVRLYVGLCRRDWFDNGNSELIEIFTELYDGDQWFRTGEQYLPVEKANQIPVVLNARIACGYWDTICQHEVYLGGLYDPSRIDWHWDNPFVTLANLEIRSTFVVPTLLRMVKRLGVTSQFRGIADDASVVLAIDGIDEAAAMHASERTREHEDMVVLKLRDAIMRYILTSGGFQVHYPNGNRLHCGLTTGKYWIDNDERKLTHVTMTLYTPEHVHGINGDQLEEVYYSNMSENFAPEDYDTILKALDKRLREQNDVSGLGSRVVDLWRATQMFPV
ncbi:hypothetical protein AVT69_gp123 [Pseudomonas phage PhiPA3]|uniref:Uncharacterized protein 124 n=1 Tax=Pseudomonas phage PhiPA3 TaxID=998086 RepID=F8SJZ8_BPPA3|nr:hypothetical protein AVT69_gp123 [Pseudomonas phage PhiPA3]AEH03548.1 hypothetical protein [Pseudomonas phage PhiPA3]